MNTDESEPEIQRKDGMKIFKKLKSKLVVNNFLRIKYTIRDKSKLKLNEVNLVQ